MLLFVVLYWLALGYWRCVYFAVSRCSENGFSVMLMYCRLKLLSRVLVTIGGV
jgi:hypothetical protein